MSDVINRSKIQVTEKSSDNLFLVTNIPLSLLYDKDLFQEELFKMVKKVVIISGADLSRQAKIQIDITFSKVIKKDLFKPSLIGKYSLTLTIKTLKLH